VYVYESILYTRTFDNARKIHCKDRLLEEISLLESKKMICFFEVFNSFQDEHEKSRCDNDFIRDSLLLNASNKRI
jgi:hypothetical protein